MSGTKVLTLIRLGILLIGVVFLCVSWGLSRSSAHKKKVCTQPVNARIVDVIRDTTYHINSVHSVTWYPIYEYTTGGKTVRRHSAVGGDKERYTVGKQVTLMVNPQNVEEYYNPEDPMGFLVKIFLVVGAVLLIAGFSAGFAGRILLGP